MHVAIEEGRGSLLTVAVDDLFPRALSFALAATGEELGGTLVGAAGFRLHTSVNGGAATCGESGLATAYAPAGAATAAFVDKKSIGAHASSASSSRLSVALARSFGPAILA